MPAIRRNWRRLALLTALLTLTGVYGYYYAREWMAKWAFDHQTVFGIDELILIALPEADLSPRNAFLVNEEEFAWKGGMVDVLHREVRSDTLFIYGFRDAAETELVREAAWYHDTMQPDSLPDTGTKRARWFSPFVLPTGTSLVSLVWSILPAVQSSFPDFPLRIRLPLLEVPSPPPDWQALSQLHFDWSVGV